METYTVAVAILFTNVPAESRAHAECACRAKCLLNLDNPNQTAAVAVPSYEASPENPPSPA